MNKIIEILHLHDVMKSKQTYASYFHSNRKPVSVAAAADMVTNLRELYHRPLQVIL